MRKTQYSYDGDENKRLIMHLRDISHTMRFLYEGKGSQKQILIVLNDMGRITQRQLTKHLGIQPGSVSEVLFKLEAAGLILRSPSEIDRRTMDISLTEQGVAAAQEASALRKQRHDEMFSCLTGEEKAQLLGLLEKINNDWAERYRNTEEHVHPHRPHSPHSRRHF